MTDYIAKARAGRVIALNMCQSGTVMFFPEEMTGSATVERPANRHVMTQMRKPMFVRSASMHAQAAIKTPELEEVANAPFVLTEEHAVEDVLRLVA